MYDPNENISNKDNAMDSFENTTAEPIAEGTVTNPVHLAKEQGEK